MDFNELISERYSVRKFRPEPVAQRDIDEILSAGHKAPTGCNYQPQRILVLNSEKSMAALRECTRCHFDAPTAMLICHNADESWKRPYDAALSSPVDAVIVATHMMLAAHNAGVGSCWVMHFNPFTIREKFNIPESIHPVALLVLGYPADDAQPLGLHYESRELDETVFYDSF